MQMRGSAQRLKNKALQYELPDTKCDAVRISQQMIREPGTMSLAVDS